MFPEITVTELGDKLKSDEKFILLDVRELSELEYAKITDSRLEVTPMSRLAGVYYPFLCAGGTVSGLENGLTREAHGYNALVTA